MHVSAERAIWLTLQHRWADETTHLRFDPLELLERLALLTPRPRVNLILYYGVLAPRAAWRSALVSGTSHGVDMSHVEPSVEGDDPGPSRAGAYQWAELMRRTFGLDVLACPRCGGRLRLVADRLWNQVAMNPGVFLGLGPCTLDGFLYGTCSTPANLNQRRKLSLSGQNPDAARLIGNLDLHTNLGTQDYRGLKLSFQRRAAAGVSLSGTYTVSRCYGDPALQTGSFPLLGSGYTNPG